MNVKGKALMKKSEHTPKGRSQKYFRDNKGLLSGKFPDKAIKDDSRGSFSGQRHMKP